MIFCQKMILNKNIRDFLSYFRLIIVFDKMNSQENNDSLSLLLNVFIEVKEKLEEKERRELEEKQKLIEKEEEANKIKREKEEAEEKIIREKEKAAKIEHDKLRAKQEEQRRRSSQQCDDCCEGITLGFIIAFVIMGFALILVYNSYTDTINTENVKFNNIINAEINKFNVQNANYEKVLQNERLTECTIEKVTLNKTRNPKIGDVLYQDEQNKFESYFIIYTRDNKDIKHVIELWNDKKPVEGKYPCYNVKQVSENTNQYCIPSEKYKGLSTC